MYKFMAAALVTAGVIAAPMTASARTVTDAEMRALLRVVKVLKLGGPSSGYYGALVLKGTNSSGVAKGYAVINGTWKTISGSWHVNAGKFCRKWAGFDGGAEICETWIYKTDTSVEVRNGSTVTGVNSW